MDRHQRKLLMVAAVCGWAVLSAGTARAGSHTWDVNELFSNDDGTIQFIELFEANGTPGEVNVQGHAITSNVNSFPLPGSSLTAPTSNKFLLIATQAFADLPDAPTPDYIIPAGLLPFFFSVDGDTVSYQPYDNLTFGGGVLPTDGISSLNFDLTTGVNSPTNYASETGSIDVSSGCNDTDGDGYGSPGDASCPAGSETDCDDTEANINPGAVEICDDTVDNDCDGATDGADSDCNGIPTMSEWGVAIMGILITILATLAMARRRQVTV